ncbi:division/cell wall cluster transcriptional repressor MraZ [Heliorestis acidaminivorans]|uniref:Transcriptional regulator MraZ n=1 Tax=Heliorestis acidaminivorans TaxID=553427 RepID=A0A6I0F448_9FIRM|nr:division/cell wall cluster transcriptional repressor MraZ [Heliorestis acidaminivorans]KAB2954530.1 division/cell wall cluster transcriptional repressor MraZ [Heliorestis acidaminivorans]
MFMGEYQHSIDGKGRLFLPSRFREALGEQFVVTKGLDGCLFIYPPEEWRRLEEKIKKLPFTRADARSFQRFFFSGAAECELDKQGRFLLPQHLRQYGVLEKDVIIIGVGTRIEIWSQERWQEYNEQSDMDFEEVAEKLVDFEL